MLCPVAYRRSNKEEEAEGNAPLKQANSQRECFVEVHSIKEVQIFLHIPIFGILLERWRTEDKDRRSRRSWCSPLYPFYCSKRQTRLNCMLQ